MTLNGTISLIMILDHHIEYLKQTLETEEGYPHKELYEFADNYILWHNLLEKYKDDPGFAADPYFKWEDRYNSLMPRGVFFNNLVKLYSLRYNVKSEEAWKIALDLEDIPMEVANFEVCYCWMNPRRCFSWDWRDLDDLAKAGFTPPFSSMQESNAWFFVNERYKKISREHLPMCTVEDFLAKKL